MKLNNESVFIYPTDTVWGIGASIYFELSKKKISEIKGSAEDKPLSIMFTSVEEIAKSFTLPTELSAEWLKKYFSMESTLGLPLSLAKISIPSWVTGKSEFVSVRCVDMQVLREIGKALNAPFFTTSLNLTGHPPIVNFNDAKNFHKTYANDIEFFGDSSHNLSGRSSTIVFLKGKAFEVIRAGARLEEIKKHLSLTGFHTA
jgi:L-threonylcarbamoyladenylate synthase